MLTPLCSSCGSYCRHNTNEACPCMFMDCDKETEVWECVNCHIKWEIDV